jgi:hypothetical protein
VGKLGGGIVRANHEAEAVLADLLAAGAIPVLEAGRLRIDGPRSVLTSAPREALNGCLPELRALVATRWRSREECVAARPCRRMSVCQEAAPDGWPCVTPRICVDCKVELPVGRRYLCEACAEAGLRKATS